MKKCIIGVWHPSVIMTYVGMGFSICGIYLSLSGQMSYAFVFLVLAAVCDMFDGVVARLFKRNDTEKEFGIQIDSLVDVCSFVLFPVCLLFCATNGHTAAYVAAVIYAVAGVARLAWFNITTHEMSDSFIGLPVIYSALILPMVYLLNSVLNIAPHKGVWIWCGIYTLLAVLFVCNFKTKKPGIKTRLIMLLVAIALIVALLFAV